jgi:hypothetical protein
VLTAAVARALPPLDRAGGAVVWGRGGSYNGWMRSTSSSSVKTMTLACIVCSRVLFGPDLALADDGDVAAAPTEESEQLDIRDLMRLVRHKPLSIDDGAPDSVKPFFVLAPSITSKPSTGFTFGGVGSLTFVHGDARSTHLSSASANLKVSVKGQTTSSVRFGIFLPNDRWFIQGDTRLQWTSLNTYSLSTTSSSAADNLKYDWFRVYETPYRRVWRRLFVGGGLNFDNHTAIRPGTDATTAVGESAYLDYTRKHGFPLTQQISAGTNLALLVDTRDNAVNTDRGWLANATYRTFFDGFLGGDSTWQQLNMDVRAYKRLSRDGRQRLALWFLGNLITGGTAPYFDLPSTASDTYGRSARGYADGRFRGPHLLYGEVEYRNTLTRNGLLGMVAFLNTTTVDGDEEGEELFRSFATGAGLGARVRFDKHSRTNICVDYGWGKQGARGLYVAIQEAF